VKTAFLNLKVRFKLTISFCLLTLFTIIVGGLGLFNIQRLQMMDQDLFTYQTLPLLELRVIHGAFEENRSLIRDIILEEDLAKSNSYLQAIEENRKKIDEALERFSKSLLTKEEQKQYTYLVNVLENFDYHLEQVMELCRRGNKTFAYTVLSQDGPKLSENFDAAMEKLTEIKKHTAQDVALSSRQRADNAAWVTGAFVLVAVICALALGLIIARLISIPLIALAQVADEISRGNLNVEISEKYRKFKDEIGQLGLVFQSMSENLRQLINKITESAEQLAASAEELNVSAGQSAEVVIKIAETVDLTADGAENQARALAEAMTTVTKLASAVRQIASHSSEAAAIAEQAAEAAYIGGEKVELVVKKMEDIKKAVDHSAEVVTELGNRSKEIEQIVSTISYLADQTNLLALNAAIEAARAGDEGRGFAVVAEEVRKLAEQSQLATKQIAALIESVQLDTNKAVSAMAEGTREVQEGYGAVSEAGGSFAEISGLVKTVSGQNQEILAAVEGIAEGSQRMVDTISQVEQISRQTAGQAQSVSAATQEQSATMEEIAASSDVLAQLADQLYQAISWLKVT